MADRHHDRPERRIAKRRHRGRAVRRRLGAIALSSLKSDSIRAIVTFEAGRRGRQGCKPNNNCAPDSLAA